MRAIETTVERVRQPKYTGENRCTPCTVLNVVLAVVCSIPVFILWPPAGALAAGVFLVLIYLRGYLIPGTPELTERYLPDRVLRAFDKGSLRPQDPPRETATSTGSHDGSPTALGQGGDGLDPDAIESLLLSAGVVEAAEDDLRLGEQFRAVWWRRIRRYRDDSEAATAQLASVLGIDPATLVFEDDARFVVEYDGAPIGRWASDAAFYSDLAVEPTLAEWLPGWEDLDDRRRTELIAGMRAFLTSCPACEAELTQVEDVRRSCCTSDVVDVSVDCPACGAQVFSGSYR